MSPPSLVHRVSNKGRISLSSLWNWKVSPNSKLIPKYDLRVIVHMDRQGSGVN